jgi:exosome complex component RRP4
MESKLCVQDRQIAAPGELLAEGMDYLPSQGTYRQGDHIRAGMLGLARIEGKVIKLIPLSGRYMPKVGDVVVGQVDDILMSGWRLNINCAYSAVLPMKDATPQYIEKGEDLTKFFALGDWMVTRISNVTSQKLVDISMRGPGLKKFSGGRIFTVNAQKVPRIIGKEGSMLAMIKQATGCRLVVGQNGVVWLDGEPQRENVAVEAIRMIESQSHIPGLTERVKAFLDERLRGMPPPPPMPEEEPSFSAPETFRDRPPREFGDRRGGFRRGPPRGGGFRDRRPRFGGRPHGGNY